MCLCPMACRSSVGSQPPGGQLQMHSAHPRASWGQGSHRRPLMHELVWFGKQQYTYPFPAPWGKCSQRGEKAPPPLKQVTQHRALCNLT